jgi:predicted Zn finger-like uncharacterized protein
MTSQVTQCPKCNTSFRVTESQLTIANGAVRCGSCLHIFNAPDHWLSNVTALSTSSPTPTPPVTEAEPEASISPAPEEQQDALETIFDDMLFDDEMFSESIDELPDIANIDDDEDKEAEESSSYDTSTIDSHDATDDDTYSTIDELDDDIKLFSDDMATEHDDLNHDDLQAEDEDDDFLIGDDEPSNLFEAEMNDDEDSQADEDDTKFSSSFLDLNSRNDDTSIFKELNDFDGDDSGEDDWAKKLLEEEEEEHHTESANPKGVIGSDEDELLIDDEPDPFETIPGIFDDEENSEENENYELIFDTEPSTDDSEEYDLASEEDEPSEIINELSTEEPDHQSYDDFNEDSFELNEPLLAGDRIGHDNTAFINTFEPEPVVIATRIDRSKWIQRGWIAAILLAIFALMAQYFSFNFDRLSRDPSYRPTISSICNVIGCTVPTLNDISKIRSTNLVVRSHPKNQQALVVDAIITNRADFQQQFPVMELEFTDLDGNIVAGRRFTPNEYLQGELTGSTMMPSMQPVYISLEIVDPGTQAVNYQLKFHAK